ncbi:ribonuclease Z [Leptobacterium sp. I13]|uniref:ribonuclease Z n=1 Tax=Leptobacterium meishanense TaxID=3128904 RepID=UPI0030EDBE44
MVFDKQGNTTIITKEPGSIETFLSKYKASYPEFKNDHIILNLFSFDAFEQETIAAFLQLSEAHKKHKKSFVMVTDKITYEELPDMLIVVPTIQEAHDVIEMEEIERDLGF